MTHEPQTGTMLGRDCEHAMSESPAVAWHQPVMRAEVLRCLDPRPGLIMVDATVGTGGHSLDLLPRLLPDGRLIAVDQDGEALALAQQRLREFEPNVTLLHGNFRELPTLLTPLGLTHVDGLLLDLGMSSVHVDQPARGFSFSREGPLDMRMDQTHPTTAAALVNTLSETDLTMLFERFGEERFARRIAARIVTRRRAHPIETTSELARLVTEAVPSVARHGRLHPATRVFQALRIAVNEELDALEACLEHLAGLLNPTGRAVILTFHSLEDRMVKRAFIDGARAGRWTVLTKKPLRPSMTECQQNPRARSAKLRAIVRGAGD